MNETRDPRLAEAVSSVLGPVPMGVLLSVAVGINSGRGALAGVGWGLLTVFCAAVLPAAATSAIRRRPQRTRRTRLAYMMPAVLSASLGLIVLLLFPAPHSVRVLGFGFVAGLLASASINAVYRCSNHVAAVAGGVILGLALLGPWIWLGAVVVALVAWSRVVLGKHDLAEVLLGAAIGTIAAAAVVLASGL